MATESGEASVAGHGAEPRAAHASVGAYVLVGAFLTIITAVEVAVFYIPALASVLVAPAIDTTGSTTATDESLFISTT